MIAGIFYGLMVGVFLGVWIGGYVTYRRYVGSNHDFWTKRG